MVYWREYLREPRGFQRLDYLAAQITQAIYTFMGAFGDGKKSVELPDCLLKFTDNSDEAVKADADNRTLRSLATVAAMFGHSSADFVTRAKAKIEAKKREGTVPAVDTPAKRSTNPPGATV